MRGKINLILILVLFCSSAYIGLQLFRTPDASSSYTIRTTPRSNVSQKTIEPQVGRVSIGKAVKIWTEPEYGKARNLVRWDKKTLTYSITNSTNSSINPLVHEVLAVGAEAAQIQIKEVPTGGDINIQILPQVVKGNKQVNGLTRIHRNASGGIIKGEIKLTANSSERVIWEEGLSVFGPIGEAPFVSVFSADQTATEATPQDLWLLAEGYKVHNRSNTGRGASTLCQSFS